MKFSKDSFSKGIILFSSLAVFGCGSDSPRSVSPSLKTFSSPLPASLALLSAAGMTVQVVVDNVGPPIPLTVDPVNQVASGTVNNLTPGPHSFVISYDINGSLVALISTSATIGPGPIPTPIDPTLSALKFNATSITVTPASPVIPKGNSQQFTAVGTFPGGLTFDLTSDVTWRSTAPGIATVGTGGATQSVGVGAATISATVGGLSGTVSGSGTLTVGPPILTALSLSPVSALMPLRDHYTLQFTAAGRFSDGSIQDLTSSTVWGLPSNNSGATINNAGVVTIDLSACPASSCSRGSLNVTAQQTMDARPSGGPANLTVASSAPLSVTSSTYLLYVANYPKSGPGTVSVIDPGTATVPGSLVATLTGGGINFPSAIAADPLGNVWVVNAGLNGSVISSITVIPKGAATCQSGCLNFTGGGMDDSDGIAIDASGTVWVSNFGNNTVTRIPAGATSCSGCIEITGGGLDFPQGIVVDGAGNIWVANFANSSVTRIPPNQNSCAICINFAGGNSQFSDPRAIAVDPSGNAWVVSTTGSNIVTEIPKGEASTCSTCVTYDISSSQTAVGVAGIVADGKGNVFIADESIDSVTEIPAGATTCSFILPASSPCPEINGGAFNAPQGLAVDASNNIWVGNGGSPTVGRSITEIPYGTTACTPTTCPAISIDPPASPPTTINNLTTNIIVVPFP